MRYEATRERVKEALRIAKQGNLTEARGILLLAEGNIPEDEMERAWGKFGKMWRGE